MSADLRAAFLDVRHFLDGGSRDDETLGQAADELELLVGGSLPPLQARLADEALGRLQAALVAPLAEREPLVQAANRLLQAGTPKAPEGEPAEPSPPEEPAPAVTAEPTEPSPPEELAPPVTAEPSAPPPASAPASAADLMPFDEAPPPPPSQGSAPRSAVQLGPESCTVEEDPELVLECVEETFDNLGSAEGALLDLEQNPDDAQLIDTTFRAFHTVKGIAGFLKLTLVTELAHAAENVLSKLRSQEMRYEGAIPSLTLDAVDLLRRMTQELQNTMSDGTGVVTQPESWGDLVLQLREVAEHGADAATATGSAPSAAAQAAPGPAEAETAPSVPEPSMSEASMSEASMSEASMLEPAAATAQANPDPIPAEEPVVERAAPPAAPGPAPAPRAREAKGDPPKQKRVEPFVRVRTERLDELLDTVGELVIAHSMLAEDPALSVHASMELQRKVGHVGKIVRGLQDFSTSLRMVPMGPTFKKMGRVVRDVALKSGKQVILETSGEDTEIDRNLVDVLSEPLIHMVRNAVDHGVEDPDTRRAAGKPDKGTVKLSAYHEGGFVVVELSDDGKGLDRERIRQKAIDNGVISPSADLSEEETLQLIFSPGLSTAAQVTDLSGRGVGMDVVRRNIEALNGRIGIASTPGKGSTFTISLPLTLAITDGMVVSVGDERFIVPTLSIVMSFQPKVDQLTNVAGHGELVTLRGQPLPIVRLRDYFGLEGGVDHPVDGLLVVVQDQEGAYALMVDRLLGQQQVVTKSLGDGIGPIPGISGGAILADGRVGLILDPGSIGESTRTRRSGAALH